MNSFIDRTGLTGFCHFHMQCVYRPPANPANQTEPAEPGADPEEESIFTAIHKQLGLKLELGKGPVEVLVIDHAQKTGPEWRVAIPPATHAAIGPT